MCSRQWSCHNGYVAGHLKERCGRRGGDPLARSRYRQVQAQSAMSKPRPPPVEGERTPLTLGELAGDRGDALIRRQDREQVVEMRIERRDRGPVGERVRSGEICAVRVEKKRERPHPIDRDQCSPDEPRIDLHLRKEGEARGRFRRPRTSEQVGLPKAMDASQVAIARDRIPDLVEMANALRSRRSVPWLTNPMQARRARHLLRDPSRGQPADPR
jgi:hypothetical protein